MHKIMAQYPYRLLFIAVVASYIPALFYPYTGEEAVYTISSLEMWQAQHWFTPLLYGGNYQRPPLLNWFIIPLCQLLGFENNLLAARLVAISSSLATAAVIVWGTKQLFNNQNLSKNAAFIYLGSLDMLLRRAWLAYADPLFSFFIFTSCLLLWLSAKKQNLYYLLISLVCITCAFYTKALTAYIFYIVVGICLLLHKPYRKFLLQPTVLALHALFFLVPVIHHLNAHADLQSNGMLADITNRMGLLTVTSYLFKIFNFPIDFILRFMPFSGIVLFFLYKSKITFTGLVSKIRPYKIIFFILTINLLPYWIAPESHIRYLQPLYPWFAIILALCLEHMVSNKKIIFYGAWLALGINFIFSSYIFYIDPWQAKRFKNIAHQVLSISKDKPLYIEDDSAKGLSIAAWINTLRLPKKAITRLPLPFEEGYVLVHKPDSKYGMIVAEYTFKHSSTYLLCKGSFCKN